MAYTVHVNTEQFVRQSISRPWQVPKHFPFSGGLLGNETTPVSLTLVRSALHAAVVRDDLEVAALLMANPGLSGIEVDDLCDPDG